MTNYRTRRQTNGLKQIVAIPAGATLTGDPDPKDERWALVEYKNREGQPLVLVRVLMADLEPEPEPEPQPQPPTITFTSNRTSVVAGEAVTFEWAVDNVDRVDFWNGISLEGVGGHDYRTVTPTKTSAYYVQVVAKDGQVYKSREITVTVTVKPAPRPQRAAPGLGVHVITYGRGMDEAYAQGCRAFTVLDDYMQAARYAQGDPMQWTPDCGYPIVFYRPWYEANNYDGDWIYNWMGGALQYLENHPNGRNVVIAPVNEWDIGGPDHKTPEGMADFCKRILRILDLLNARGFFNVAMMTASMGTPEFTNPGVCDAIRQYLAPHWNSGRIRFMDLHNYSPRLEHIDDEDDLVWYERRWEFLFTDCGFKPDAPGFIVSTETGEDEGGIGGFKAHQRTREQVLYWCRRNLEVQARPLVVNGVSYPSPFKVSTVYRLGRDGQWQGHAVDDYMPLLWKL